MTNNTIDENEVEKFSKLAAEWWNPVGKFRPLHQINPVRIAYLKDRIIKNFNLDSTATNPLAGINLLDVGCGGGLLSEPFARLDANVTAIDASEKNIKTAKLHSEENGLIINYQATTIENLSCTEKQYDVILAMEVIEHVANVELFIDSCSKLLKPNGIIFIATLNRTIKSYLFAIIGAEYLLKLLPVHTHEWSKFLKPSEIAGYLRKNNINLKEIKGMSLNLIKNNWEISNNTSVNYIILAKK